MSIRLSIVIPAVERGFRQQKLVHSCFQQSLSSKEFEVILVVPENSASLNFSISDENSFKILTIPENNVSLARNTGIAAAAGDYVLLLDDDVVLTADNYFADILKLSGGFSSSSFIMGGSYLSSDDAPLVTATANSLTKLWIHSGLRTAGAISEARFLPGGVLFAPIGIFRTVSFPNEVPWGGEDSVFIKSAQDLGIKTYYTSVMDIVHLGSHSLQKFIRRAWFSGRAQGAFAVPTESMGRKFSVLGNLGLLNLLTQAHLLSLHFFVLMTAKLFYKAQRYIPVNNK